MDRRLLYELDRVAGRVRRLRLWTALAATWLLAAAAGAALLALNRAAGWFSPWTAPGLAACALIAALVCCRLALRSAGDYRCIARRIESRHPELKALLLTAIEQRPARPLSYLGYLQDSVVREALSHASRRNWRQTVPDGRLRAIQAGHLAAFLSLAIVMTSLVLYAGPKLQPNDARPAAMAPGAARYDVEIDPGDTEIERGASLLVLARFSGSGPGEATLVHEDRAGGAKSLSMARSLDDPVFGGRIAEVLDHLTYHVQFAQQRTRAYRVAVFDYPKLEQADARLVFPEYTSLEETLAHDIRHVTAVEGARLTLICRLNKPVVEARLASDKQPPLELAASGEDPKVYQTTFTIKESRRYQLHLVDAEGRRNKEPAEIVVTAIPNRPPELKFAWPQRDVEVSPLEELKLQASLWDDFGLKRYGLTYNLGGDQSKELVLGGPANTKERLNLEHLLDFEALAAQPDQLVSYYLWADDADPAGQPRRTFGDMYFAEVRHFEEIFRQGQQPPGGESQERQPQPSQGGGNGQAAEELAALQKQIVSGLWKVIRRETGGPPSGQLASDGKLLHESQQSALGQAEALAENVEDAESRAHIDDVQRHMRDAVRRLAETIERPAVEPLRPALTAAQAAYQSLLKLRAREHRVVRGNQRGGQSGGRSASSRSQRQLDQLELSSAENRYETQRSAAPPQDPAQSEVRQVLNRLRELARRQEDLNRRLREQQSALEESLAEDRRQEVRRQLKRLREEEQQILRDTDELRSRMERPINQERMADARQQLDRTRSNVQKASEALQEGLTSQAAASGARAERELKELQDEFRRQAANRFADEMTQMREDARQLDQQQQRLAELLSQLDRAEAATLHDRKEREEARRGLEQQEENLGGLLDRMQQTVQDAEQAEPLLSSQLYDTLRKSNQQHVDQTLETARQMLEQGFLDEAVARETEARQGVREIRRGVERAAESVLGDETQSLRRAGSELEQLADQINQEIASSQPDQQSSVRPAPKERAGRQQDQTMRDGKPQQPPPADAPAPTPGGRPAAEVEAPTNRPSSGPARGQSQQPGEPAEQRRGSPRLQPGEGQRPGSRDDDRPNGPGGLFDRLVDDLGGAVRPITGEGFRQWSDRLRDVEEMMDDPDLRAEAARIRDRAREVRTDYTRHSKEPNWAIVREFIAEPLTELRREVAEVLLRRSSRDALAPIDRDPAPRKYAEWVRRYYERLGSGQ